MEWMIAYLLDGGLAWSFVRGVVVHSVLCTLRFAHVTLCYSLCVIQQEVLSALR